MSLSIEAEQEPYVAPRTTTETIVATIWGAVLGNSRISVHCHFFDAGGDSLLAIRILSRLRQAYELDLPLKTIFDYPTIAELATRLDHLLTAAGKESRS